MASFFVSSGTGNDDGPGTVESPLASIAAAVASVGSGDSLFLKRGDTWFESFSMGSRTDVRGLRIGTYGRGPRPMLCGLKCSNIWNETQPGVWCIDLTVASDQIRGFRSEAVDVGFIVDQTGNVHGVKRWELESLKDPWDFYSDEEYLYVKSNVDPGAGVGIAVKANGVNVPRDVVVQSLHIYGWGGHGIQQRDGLNSVVEDCVVELIGGSQLSGTTRYGNGVEVWIGAENVVYRGNCVRQTYDAAFTMQGSVDVASGYFGWRDVHFAQNLIENCNQSFETWADVGANGETGHGFERCSFTRNTARFAGENWAGNIRPDLDGKGTHLLTYGMFLPVDIELERNVFYMAKDNFAFHAFGVPKGWASHDNIIHLTVGQPILHGHTETAAESAVFVRRWGTEINSRFLSHRKKLPRNGDGAHRCPTPC